MFFSTGRHDSAALKQIAVAKLKNNKEVFRDPAFRKKIEGEQVQGLLLDIFEEIL